ncbi:Adenosine monophosphate-protein transferase SoFic [Pelotomaculum sp. FP]|uniref:Fic family protein n=1 Tax=Pelotomaculum sp. FP TaxID=261474 RepID=UPI001103608E|nr:Fic family protein [Pelotomaculum sp. FP]TEB13798.1 Adenosine monophosphate-protein transferase SoFic [Pelotomaculum sp. FP]
MDKEHLFELYTNRYLNKKDIMYRLPSEIKLNEFWSELEKYRKARGQEVQLLDQQDHKFWFCPIPYRENLGIIDQYAKKTISNHIIDKIIKDIPASEKALIMDALIDEAFNSSVIEGAFSTKKRTKEMINKKAKPLNTSEQMIYNNYKALEYILENLHMSINDSTVQKIYKIITENTLDEESTVDKYRNDAVIVFDYANQTEVYEGPNYILVPKMMEDLFSFIHSVDNLHPVEKASILHFYFVYIHPFFDGNGRTARALSYMYLLHQGYDFFKFFSVSTVIKDQKSKYYKAIQDVEDYGSDLTYFIEFNTKMIITSITNVVKRLEKEYGKALLFDALKENGVFLADRQKKCLEYFIKTEKKYITIEEYIKRYKVSYETSRKDLNILESMDLFSKEKIGKKYVYKFIGLEKLGMGEFATTTE